MRRQFNDIETERHEQLPATLKIGDDGGHAVPAATKRIADGGDRGEMAEA